MLVTKADLEAGRVVKVSPKVYAHLLGKSLSTLSRHRHDGTGIPFEIDAYGRVFYSADDVLESLNRQKFTSTSQYPHDGCRRMEKARAGKSALFFD